MTLPSKAGLNLEGKLILASASARRLAILESSGLTFEVEPADVDESVLPGTEAEPAALELALRKAREVASRHAEETGWVIGSDTIVALGAGESLQLLAKPADETEAREMLESLSGSRHRVVTGVAVISLHQFEPGQPGLGPGVISAFERTWVSMRPILPAEIEAYVLSGEWRGKAGGYAIQENADAFVERLEEGGFDNVVGLPLGLTLELLRKAGAFP